MKITIEIEGPRRSGKTTQLKRIVQLLELLYPDAAFAIGTKPGTNGTTETAKFSVMNANSGVQTPQI